MFGRGNWAIFGLELESHEAFATGLRDRLAMLNASQMAASAITRQYMNGTIGINPFGQPRLDEGSEKLGIKCLTPEEEATLALWLTSPEESQQSDPLPDSILENGTYAFTDSAFRLHPTANLYALWFVVNEWKDVSHVLSLKEQQAYDVHQRPYRFLQTGPKKELDTAVRAKTAVKRKQFPVLIDFEAGRVYMEEVNKNHVTSVREMLGTLGAVTTSLAWRFGGDSSWYSVALNKLKADSMYQAEFKKAEKDAARFKKEEREEIEDPEIRRIVSKFFSMTQLESELWAGLAAPAKIQMHKTTSGIVAATPINATTLLNVSSDTLIAGASLTLQERIASMNKRTNAERIFRKDALTFDLNDQINQTECGAALLRGFDLSSFRREVMREAKKNKQMPSVGQLWLQWLMGMADGVRTIEATLRDLLELSGSTEAGIQPLFGGGHDDVIETEE